MADRCTGVCRCERCAARIGEQVEHADRASCSADHPVNKIPVCRLLGKQARVLEAHGLELEREVSVMNGPLLGQPADFPLAAACIRAVIDGVRTVPCLAVLVACPNGLRVGPLQNLAAPSFDFFSAAAVEHGVVFPVICDPHKIPSLIPGM